MYVTDLVYITYVLLLNLSVLSPDIIKAGLLITHFLPLPVHTKTGSIQYILLLIGPHPSPLQDNDNRYSHVHDIPHLLLRATLQLLINYMYLQKLFSPTHTVDRRCF